MNPVRNLMNLTKNKIIKFVSIGCGFLVLILFLYLFFRPIMWLVLLALFTIWFPLCARKRMNWSKAKIAATVLIILYLITLSTHLSSIYQEYIFVKNFDDFKVRIKFENTVGEIQEYGTGNYDVVVMEGGYVYRLWGDEKRKGDYIPEGQHLGVRYWNPPKFDYETKKEIALGEEKPLGKILDCVIAWGHQGERYRASEFKAEGDLISIEYRLSKIPSNFLKSFIVVSPWGVLPILALGFQLLFSQFSLLILLAFCICVSLAVFLTHNIESKKLKWLLRILLFLQLIVLIGSVMV